MRNKILLGILSIVILLSVATAVGTYTYAWLTAGQPVAFDAEGSAVAGYFYSGTGTKDDPYTLTNAKHVYNLAWLQYLGVFNNEVDASGNVIQFYFEIHENLATLTGSDTIDMSTYQNGDWQVIPPIGTTEYPFIGVFDGNGYTISNAVIANKIGADAITQYPPSVGQEVHNAEVIGFFGVIGEYNGTGVVSEDQLKVLGVSNLKLDNVTIQTSTEESLAGLLAGFVNGNLTNVLISSGTITAGSGVSAFQTTFTDGFVLNPNSALSGYSLIGDYNTTKINWLGGPLDGPTTDVGQNDGFGGSIDMLTMAKRVTYMMAAGYSTGTNYYSTTTAIKNTYHFVGQTGEKYSFNFQTNGHTLAFATGTYLPLNIDNEVTQSYYANASTPESIVETNTGYLVGKATADSWGYSANSPVIRSRLLGQVCFSLTGTHSNWKNVGSYSDTLNNQLQILTKSVDGTYYVIGDDINNLTSTSDPFDCYKGQITVQRYDSETLNFTQYGGENNVRNKLADVLNGSTSISGIQFSKAIPTNTSMLTGISVELGGQTVTSLVEGTIHFRSKKGVITMVAATLYSTEGNVTSSTGKSDNNASASSTSSYNFLPKLYKVDRTGANVVLTAIDTIYINRSTGDIAYNTNPGGYEKVFDYNTMGDLVPLTGSGYRYYMNSLYYFELPVDEGEYVLGGSGNNSTYLIYLDIGGNAGSSGNNGTSGPGNNPNPSGNIEGVYFVDGNGNPILQTNITPDEGKDPPAVAFEIKLSNINGTSVSFDGSVSGVITGTIPANTTVTTVVKREDETDGS